jgi:hypothetical protein
LCDADAARAANDAAEKRAIVLSTAGGFVDGAGQLSTEGGDVKASGRDGTAIRGGGCAGVEEEDEEDAKDDVAA